jgi:iron complex outermembrane receptor protein
MGGKARNTEAMMGNGITFADTTMNEFGGYIMLRQKFMDRLTLSAGLRLQYHTVSGSEWVPHIGLNFLINSKNILKASVSKGFRNPTIRELFMWQPANPDLRPENMWSYEAGYLTSLFKEKVKLEATVYYQDGSNLIETVGQYPNVQYQNTGSFKHYGVEFSGSYQIITPLAFEGNYSWLHMDQPVSGAPVHKLYTALRYSPGKFSAKLSGMYIHDLYTNAALDQKQTYFLLNARVSYQVLKFMNIWVSGENLLDQEYEINYDYPMPGITVIGGIDLKFQSKEK